MTRFDNFNSFFLYIEKHCCDKAGNIQIPDNLPIRYVKNHGIVLNIPYSEPLIKFYKLYFNEFSFPFLQEEAEKLTCSQLKKDWVLLCLKKVRDLDYYKREFENELSEWSQKLKLSFEIINRVISSQGPFVSLVDYCNYVFSEETTSVNTYEEKAKYFFILLLSYLQGKVPQRNNYVQDLFFKRSFNNFQRNLTNDFISQIPFRLKERALLLLFDAFKQINSLNLFDEKFSLSYNRVLYGNEIPMDGLIFISWDKVDFYDGFYVVYHPSFPTGGKGRDPYRVVDASSRRIFNKIQNIFLKKLPPISAVAKRGRIVKVKNIYGNLCSCISILEHRVLAQSKAEKKEGNKIEKQKKKFLNQRRKSSFRT